MNKENLDNVFSQLSNVDNVDELLRDEGLIPKRIVKDGIKRLKEIQNIKVSKKKVIDLLKVRMTQSITNETMKAFEALNDLIPSMNGDQLRMVFRGLNNPVEKDVNLDELVNKLKSDSKLSRVMKKYNSGKEN